MSSPTPVDTSSALPTAVVPGLYIGDKRLAANKDILHSLGITHIVNVTHDVRHYFENEPHTFTYLRCPCHDTDTADLHTHFTPACNFIHSALTAGHACLIHCQQGISRSATLATAYLIQQHKLTLRDAYVRVKQSRPTVKVNANFLRQLMRWEKECTESAAANKGTMQPTVEERTVSSESGTKRRRVESESERREQGSESGESKDSRSAAQKQTSDASVHSAEIAVNQQEEESASKRQKAAVEVDGLSTQPPSIDRRADGGSADG